KSRLLDALSKLDEQVLNLEEIARHRGSVLGKMPGQEQPSQKYFESCICSILSGFDPGRPVYIESESKKIGSLRVPQALMEAMWMSRCIRLDAGIAVRNAILAQDYRHFFSQPEALVEKLDCLTPLHGGETIDSWKAMIDHCEWDNLVASLLEKHYDPAYRKSIEKHYEKYSGISVIEVPSPEESAFTALAGKIRAD
ncbi:MAG: tRNA 2-selenouridine(34) synthase MnmH, partial [Burkholderiales bacterium]